MTNKPLTIDISTKDNSIFIKTKFKETSCMAKRKGKVLIKFPFLAIRKNAQTEMFFIPESSIKVQNFDAARKLIGSLTCFCESITGLKTFGIEDKIQNSKPDIPIMYIQGGIK